MERVEEKEESKSQSRQKYIKISNISEASHLQRSWRYRNSLFKYEFYMKASPHILSLF